jgi:hypothetical protein
LRFGLQSMTDSEISEWQRSTEALQLSMSAMASELQLLRTTLDNVNAELRGLRQASPEFGSVVRQILQDVAENRLYVGAALLSAFTDVRLAGQVRAAISSAEWLHENADRAPTYSRRVEMLEALFPFIPADGDLAEFGVFTGAVTRFVRPRFMDRRYHAFDSWRGVPEAMGLSVAKYSFDLNGVIPELPPETTIHAGWFDETIPKWREQFEAPIAFAYIDCDLYESVKTVLEGLTDRIRPGTILAFDDWYNFPNWEAHSLKASREWAQRHGIKMEPMGFTTLEHAGSFRITV